MSDEGTGVAWQPPYWDHALPSDEEREETARAGLTLSQLVSRLRARRDPYAAQSADDLDVLTVCDAVERTQALLPLWQSALAVRSEPRATEYDRWVRATILDLTVDLMAALQGLTPPEQDRLLADARERWSAERLWAALNEQRLESALSMPATERRAMGVPPGMPGVG